MEARQHEKPPEIDFAKLPNADVEITDAFLTKHKILIVIFGTTLARAAG